MKYSNEELKALLIASIPKRVKEEQVQKDFVKSLILNGILAVGCIAGIVISIIQGGWAIFSVLIIALLAIALMLFYTFKSRSVLLDI